MLACFAVINSSSLFAAVLAVALTACGGPGDTHMDIVFDACEPLVLVPEDASDGQRASIGWAVAMWAQVANTRLTLEEDPALPHLTIRFEAASLGDWGLYDDEQGIVLINSRIDDRHARAITVAHELGHAFGLWHLDEDKRRSVMNQGNLEIEPNDGDGHDVADLWGYCQK